MRCNICKRDIVDDSIYCSYCGNRVDRLASQSGPDDDCIRPHMPKKKCAECGKELPGSSISDICAMCTIRRRNRELEAQREREDRAGSNRDRYDISDEFDQSVFARSSYYREPANTEQLEKKLSGRRIGCIVALAVFLILGGIIFAAAIFGYNMIAKSVSVDMSSSSYDESSEISEAALIDEQTLSREYFLQDGLYPTATDQLNYYLGEVVSLGPDENGIYSDGGFIYLSGEADYYTLDEDGDRDVFYTDPYEFCVILSENSYLPLYLKVGDTELYDNRFMVDTDGYLTEDGAEVFEMEAGDQIFSTPVLYLDELE